MRRRRIWGALVAVVLLLAACADEEVAQRGPVAPDDGLQVTGRYEGRQLAVSHGEPEVLYGNCDPHDGMDVDLCMVTRTLDGQSFGIVVQNPVVLVSGSVVPVRHRDCGLSRCDGITDVAVVDVRLDGESARATGGVLRVASDGPRYAASFELRFADGGRLTGRFNVLPPATP